MNPPYNRSANLAAVTGESEVRLPFLPLLPAALLVGCAGYAIDYTKPKTAIIAPELARYGLDSTRSQCIAEKLQTVLSVWQLRQLAIAAGAVRPGASSGPLTARELSWVSTQVKDPKVPAEFARAAEGCGLTSAQMAANPVQASDLNEPPQGTVAPTAVVPGLGASRPAPSTWINLGAAATGQTIAVDAASIAEEAPYRRAWFRLGNPGGMGGSSNSYLLRIDCASKTINSMALRKHGPRDAVTEQRDYGTSGEGAAAIETGTVMEIAYLALCI